MDDIVGELRDCAADSVEVGYKSRAQVAMLRAADDIVALQGRIVRQCQSVNELVAATERCIEERDALRAKIAELEAANTGLATEAQRLKAGLRFYARGLHFSPGDAICWDDVSGEPPNFLCDEYGTTIEDGTIAKDVLLGRDAAWSGEDWPPEELPEEIGLPPNKSGERK